VSRRLLTGAAGAALGLLVAASPAYAHGVQGRADTPVPIAVFFYAAAGVIIVSFGALAVGWSKPRWSSLPWRPAPGPLQAVLAAPVVWTGRVLVLGGTVFVLAAAAFGSTTLNNNIAPLTIFVVWWVGLVPLSVVFGNAWRELNPWATLARWLGAQPRATRPYPPAWGLWPAALLMVGVAWCELVYPTASSPRLIAAIGVGYSIFTVVGMRRYGTDAWLDRAEVFSVYTGLMAKLSPWEVRERDGRRVLGWRAPLIGVTRVEPQPGLVPFVVALLAAVSFDGLSGTDFWAARDVAATERIIETGLDPFWAGIVTATLGLLLVFVLAYAAFLAASSVAAGFVRDDKTSGLAEAFAHSLVPIAVGYSVAHYFTLLVFQSQDLIRLASDPFGAGADWFGTTAHTINFNLVTPNLIWAVQVAAIVGAHVLALVLAHDRALQLSGHSRSAVRSQYPMLALMVLLTVSGLWFLSEGMNDAT
jgi:hypothetical protein